MNQRLTAEQAQSILHRVAAGELQKKLAAEFKVRPSTISNLVRGKSWPNLDRPAPPEVSLRGCKLTPEDIPVILLRLANREKPKDVARDYGVTQQTIANVGRRKTWTHIPPPEVLKPRRRKVWEG